MTPVEEAIRMWEVFRDGVIAELANIPEKDWDYRPGPGARTLRELALHIAVAGVGFSTEVLADEPAFMRLRDPATQAKLTAPFAAAKSKADIMDVCKRSSADALKKLREEGDRLSGQTMNFMNSEQSRLSGLWFAVAHEAYHRGQLATYARALGIVPAMTQRMQAPT